eukprot:5179479-Pyramimonas_sp.AAC.1
MMNQSDSPGAAAWRLWPEGRGRCPATARPPWRIARRGSARRPPGPPASCGEQTKYILTMDQSDAGRVGIFSRWINQMQEV